MNVGGGAPGARGVALDVALFTAVAASTVAIPVLLHLVRGDRILGQLGVARDWLEANSAAVMAVVIVVIDVLLLLLVKGLGAL